MLDSNKNIHYVEKEGVPFLRFPILEKYPVIHGFSTRLGGVSKGDCTSMNLSFTRGDRREDVEENHRLFANAVGYDIETLVLTEQVHDTKIRRVGKGDTGEVFCERRSIRETDGLITDEPGVMLMTFFADCVPLLFYDPVRRAVGNAHSGWRGTVQRMGQKMTGKMKEEFGSQPENLLVVIGPSIGQCCYEVSEEVISEFQKVFDQKYLDDIYYKKPDGHYQLNLWQANKILLMQAGVKEEHICVSEVCTCCHPDLLFSHRYTHGKRGNLSAVIGLA
ncbi:MAG: peptidoglycan editing factor PgeF [Roseburia sp.]|nr:peptidoglycan editing factor PgeF [Roseburia sp.]